MYLRTRFSITDITHIILKSDFYSLKYSDKFENKIYYLFFFCKFEKILINKIDKYVHTSQYFLAKII